MISNEIIQLIIEKSKIYDAKKVVIFGSALTDYESSNDIDIACDMPGLNMFLFADDLEKSIKKTVDILPISINDPFMKIVNKFGNVIYEA